jgi:peptidoglycan-associated lipoprotein
MDFEASGAIKMRFSQQINDFPLESCEVCRILRRAVDQKIYLEKVYLEEVGRMNMGGKKLLVVLVGFCVLGLLSSCAKKRVKAESDAADSQVSDAAGTQVPEWNPDEQQLSADDINRPPVGEPVEIPELQTVYFDYDQYSLRPDALATLQSNLEWLQANPGRKILIEGHCDERGSEEYNLSLGDKRAKEVMGYLLNANVAKGRLYTISYGESRPAAAGHDESAWAKNRRAVFKAYQP